MSKDGHTVIDKTKMDKTLVGWSKYLRGSGQFSLANALDTDIIRDFYLIHELQLSTYDSYLVPAACFLDEFQKFQRDFVYDRYYLVLLPKSENCRKYSLTDFKSLEEAKNFIAHNIEGLYDQYMLRISEFEPNIYGGSIMSDEDVVMVEMVKGLQNGVAYGTENVISGVLTPLGISTRYSTQNETERSLIWKAMNGIMRDSKMVIEDTLKHTETHAIHNFSFLKGYFEFAYTKSSNRNSLRLVFFDIKLNRVYYNLSRFPDRAATL
jgi:hypothetical protein